MKTNQNWQRWTDGELDNGKSSLGIGYNVFMAILVVTVCATFIIETYPITEHTRVFCEAIDWGITWIFLCDYILRFWAKRFSIRYLFTQMAIDRFSGCTSIVYFSTVAVCSDSSIIQNFTPHSNLSKRELSLFQNYRSTTSTD